MLVLHPGPGRGQARGQAVRIIVRHAQDDFAAWQIADVVAGLGLRVVSITQGHLGNLEKVPRDDSRSWFIYFEVPGDSVVDADDIDAAIDAAASERTGRER